MRRFARTSPAQTPDNVKQTTQQPHRTAGCYARTSCAEQVCAICQRTDRIGQCSSSAQFRDWSLRFAVGAAAVHSKVTTVPLGTATVDQWIGRSAIGSLRCVALPTVVWALVCVGDRCLNHLDHLPVLHEPRLPIRLEDADVRRLSASQPTQSAAACGGTASHGR